MITVFKKKKFNKNSKREKATEISRGNAVLVNNRLAFAIQFH